jgi:hypothetical protein
MDIRLLVICSNLFNKGQLNKRNNKNGALPRNQSNIESNTPINLLSKCMAASILGIINQIGEVQQSVTRIILTENIIAPTILLNNWTEISTFKNLSAKEARPINVPLSILFYF